VPVAVVNGRLSERSFRGYQRLGDLTSQVLGQLGLIAVQNEEYAQRFRDLGASVDALHITGSMKYDGAQTDRNNPNTRRLKALAGLDDEAIVFLAGSTQEPEEALALETLRQLRGAHPNLHLIIVPRHPDRFAAVAQLLVASGIPWQRRSDLSQDKPAKGAQVLLVDAVGELAAWWGAAHVAYVGGSMGVRGGQNMIEPAAYGAAVSFGPNTRNFRDIVAAMLEERAAMVVNDGEELTAFVRHVLEDPVFADALGRRAKSLVARQLGATAKTVSLLIPLVEGPAEIATSRRAA
jgi:3-deoxy-D-manno-octulosonic-acid transferase